LKRQSKKHWAKEKLIKPQGCIPFEKAGGHQIRRCQGFAVNDYNFSLDALALKPSGFCSVGVKLR